MIPRRANPCPCASIPAGWSVIMGKKRIPVSDNGRVVDIPLNSETLVGKPTSGDSLAQSISDALQTSGACWTNTALRTRPLRLIIARTPISESSTAFTQTYLETLACGHQVINYSDFYWDEGGHPISSPPSAKRRRCTECLEAQQLSLDFNGKKAA